jgi:dihydropteroate synthase
VKTFQAGKFSLPLNEKTYIMGILNVTPDSFSDGGRFFSVENAVQHALEMREQGADIIDIGAQSTRPGYTPISPEQEWERLAPVLQALRGKLDVPVSVDTYFPQVAQAALENGADIINDVHGFTDEGMFKLAARSNCGCIIMHPCGAKGNILTAINEFFASKYKEAQANGIAQNRICFDPGVGFGKELEQNYQILANVDQIKFDGCAFLMAASRKRVIGAPCGNPPFEERLYGTIAAHTLAMAGGADILRVHDVAEAVQAARVADAILHEKQERRR